MPHVNNITVVFHAHEKEVPTAHWGPFCPARCHNSSIMFKDTGDWKWWNARNPVAWCTTCMPSVSLGNPVPQ
jgi:hypothetical protein